MHEKIKRHTHHDFIGFRHQGIVGFIPGVVVNVVQPATQEHDVPGGHVLIQGEGNKLVVGPGAQGS